MFIKIPFESEIDFKNSISEITKMSLEHDYNYNNGIVLGNFYISGEYRSHPVSVNTDTFNYTLPFTVELRDDIDDSSLEFNIEDFSYDIKDNSILKVYIEYSLKSNLKEKEDNNELKFQKVDENELESELSFIDNFLEEKEEDRKEEENVEAKGENRKDDEENETKEEEKIVINNSLEQEKTVMDTINGSDDTFVVYRIHIVEEAETVESICKKYNVSNSLVSEYNDIDNITVGDKILIPEFEE